MIPATNGSSASKYVHLHTGHSILRYIWAEHKDKKSDVSDSHRNTGVSCNYKLKLPKFKDLCIKSTEKMLQDEWMYLANTAIVKLWNISRRFQFNYKILLPDTFKVDSEEAFPRR